MSDFNKTKRTTISVRVNDDMYYLISELATLTKSSRGQVVLDFLNTAQPHIEQMIVSLRLAADKNPKSFTVMTEAVQNAINDVMTEQNNLFSEVINKKK